jgi:hypothetical protein
MKILRYLCSAMLPFSFVVLPMLVNAGFRLFFRFPMITRDVICLGTLSDDDIWLKMAFMQVLNCTNSPRRAWSSPRRVRENGSGVARHQARHGE